MNVLRFETESGRVILAVYNTAGERVRTLVDQSFAPGEHNAVWNGGNDAGGNTQLCSDHFPAT